MRIPSISCKIVIFSTINPSEDPAKVEKAILNMFPNAKIKTDSFSSVSNSKDLNLLEKVSEIIRANNSQKIFQKQLEKNLDVNSTWFYLNKQAAFVGVMALCENAEESPLGPIKVTLTSTNITKIIDWFTLDN